MLIRLTRYFVAAAAIRFFTLFRRRSLRYDAADADACCCFTMMPLLSIIFCYAADTPCLFRFRFHAAYADYLPLMPPAHKR